ncbi:hypothetical protein GCM10010116_52630 [Microbispora rosea subsp. aerata]|nr:chaplin family protein [Microbispora rosea]GGO26220.1 hypothetical protein GCM10010116_52630 [Microbispora rosea subsp. aerata]GIH58234.1 hypothetical protein Mro02_51480 [Microbispora rosea subsp. aerata]GLJ86992.1 hypothetical protein GCM10017588_57350 [Microbispora rosea subsp. aerata]
MRTWAKGSTSAAFLAVGVLALGSGTAFADTDGSHSVLGGNQVNIPVTLPIDISGNAVAVVGRSQASSLGGSAVRGAGVDAGENKTSGAGSILGGNQVVAPITAPVDICGNAVSVIGRSDAGCRGGAAVKGTGRRGDAGGNRTSGVHSIGGGNQVVAPITAPVNLCGNSIAVFGNATAGCRGGAFVGGHGGVRAGGNRTSGRSSILGGNQVVAPITAPVNVCGNSVAVIGKAFSGCTGGSSVGGSHGHGGKGSKGGKGKYGGHHGKWHRPGSTGHDNDGRFSVGSGTQVVTPIVTPADVCGNGSGSCKGGHGGKGGHGHGGHKGHGHGGWSGGSAGGNRTSGVHSVVGGNQVVAPITVPINICGNSVAIIGKAFSGCRGGATVIGGWSKHGGRWGAGGNVTSGRGSILGGNQVVAPITAPINICGNAVSVIGRSQAGCRGGASVLGGGVGAGGNITSGRHGILAGNQIVAPITAPINICGNSVAVLGDAAAGCLGGAQAGGAWKRHGYWAYPQHKAARGAVMPAMPTTSVLSGKQTVQPMSAPAAPSAPVIGELPNMLGLPETPSLPVAAAPKGKKSGSAPAAVSKATATLDGATRSLPAKQTLEDATASLPIADTARNLPTGDLGKTTDGLLPLGGLKLISAEQPVGLTGMNPASFLALALGAMFAASASLFAVTRRFRLGRK